MCSPKNPPASGAGSPDKPAAPAPHAASAPASPSPQAPAPSTAEAAAQWVEISAGSGRYLLVPIADSRGRPKGEYEGKREWVRASKGGKGDAVLLYLMVPNAKRAATFRHATAKGETALPAPRMIYRMPGSPLYTHLLLDGKDPGRLVVEGADSGSVDLAALASRLRGLPLFLDDDGGVAYDDLPTWMGGSVPQ